MSLHVVSITYVSNIMSHPMPGRQSSISCYFIYTNDHVNHPHICTQSSSSFSAISGDRTIQPTFWHYHLKLPFKGQLEWYMFPFALHCMSYSLVQITYIVVSMVTILVSIESTLNGVLRIEEMLITHWVHTCNKVGWPYIESWHVYDNNWYNVYNTGG